MKPLKIKVSCAGILDSGTVPKAVLTADVQIPGKPATRTRYVLLESDTRDALSRMRRECKHPEDGADYYPDYGVTLRALNPECAFPPLLRTHAFDAAGVQFEPTDPIARRAGIWSNGEPLWVRTDLAPVAIAVLARWRALNPQRKDQIWAPNWLTLVGCQALAIAAELPVPQANETEGARREVGGAS